MSLDVSLTLPGTRQSVGSGIFIRESGETKEITRAEWDARNPGVEPIAVISEEMTAIYTANITHNLNSMANAAGIYQALWRPEEIGATHAAQLIEPLTRGLVHLREDPEYFKTLNPENGWGTYEGLLDFVLEYLIACLRCPDAIVSVSR